VKASDGGLSGTVEAGQDGLAEALCRIVADPGRVEALHHVLGPFCHRGRNILNTLKISLYLARRKEASGGGPESLWHEVEERYRVVEDFFDRLQMIWRPLPLAVVRLPLSLLLEDRRSAWVARFAATERLLRIDRAGEDDPGDYDPNCLGIALDAFVDWRAAVGTGGGEVRLRWWTEAGRFELHWQEPVGRSRARSKPGVPADCGGALALPLLGRAVAAHGGTMELVEPSGRDVRISWPQCACAPD
jgi:hypothetical protein